MLVGSSHRLANRPTPTPIDSSSVHKAADGSLQKTTTKASQESYPEARASNVAVNGGNNSHRLHDEPRLSNCSAFESEARAIAERKCLEGSYFNADRYVRPHQTSYVVVPRYSYTKSPKSFQQNLGYAAGTRSNNFGNGCTGSKSENNYDQKRQDENTRSANLCIMKSDAKQFEHHRIQNKQHRLSRPVSRQTVTRLMPGLKNSSHRSRYDASGTIGRRGPTFTHDTSSSLPLRLGRRSEPSILSPVKKRSDPMHRTAVREQYKPPTDDAFVPLQQKTNTESVSTCNIPAYKTEKEESGEMPPVRHKSQRIIIADEPSEARRKKRKKREAMAIEKIDPIIEHHKTILSEISEKTTGQPRAKSESADDGQKKELTRAHEPAKQGKIRRDPKYKGDAATHETDKLNYNIADKPGKRINKRRRINSNNGYEATLSSRENAKQDKEKQHRRQKTHDMDKGNESGSRNRRHEYNHAADADKENDASETNQNKEKKVRKIKCSKICPIDDGSGPVIRDRQETTALFCVEKKEDAEQRRANMKEQNEDAEKGIVKMKRQKKEKKNRKVRYTKIHPGDTVGGSNERSNKTKEDLDRSSAMLCVESEKQAEKRGALKNYQEKENRIRDLKEEEDDGDNFRPGVWNCDIVFKRPTSEPKKSNAVPKHVCVKSKTTKDLKYDVPQDGDNESTGRVEGCASGIINFFRRIFKRN